LERWLGVVLNWTSGQANSEYGRRRDRAIGPNPNQQETA
jgi:hypothetical protein